MRCSHANLPASTRRTVARRRSRTYASQVLCPTPPDRLCDAEGRPYFLWDNDLTLDEFRLLLAHPDAGVRRYWLAQLVRQAKPDDVRSFVDLATLDREWPTIAAGVGRQRDFWAWRLRYWREHGV